MNNQQHLLQALNPGREAILASYACQSVVDHMYVDDLMHASLYVRLLSPLPHLGYTWGVGLGAVRLVPCAPETDRTASTSRCAG